MIKKRFKIGIILFIIFAIGGAAISYYVKSKNVQPEYTTAKVQLANLVQTVSETGTVKPASQIDLNFLNSGNIAKIFIKTGDNVKQNQVLAELDYSGLTIKQKEAIASLQVARANLNKVLSGATTEDIAVSQANVNQAKKNYDDAINELDATRKTTNENIKQTQKTLDDLQNDTDADVTTYEQALSAAKINLSNTKKTYQQAITNKQNSAITAIDGKIASAKTALDSVDTVLNDYDIQNTFSIKNPSYSSNAKIDYNYTIGFLNAAKNSLDAAQAKNTDSDIIKQAVKDAINLLNVSFQTLNDCYSSLENTVVTSYFTQTELDAYKTNINTQLTTVSTGATALQTAEQNLDDAILSYNTNIAASEKSLAQAQTNLDSAIINARNSLNTAQMTAFQQITAAQSKVNSAAQALQVAEAELTKIKAPAKSQDIDLGQAQVAQAQAILESIANQIQNSIIKAPIDGVITDVGYETGETPLAGKTVISMLAKNNFDIEADISEADIAKVKVNNPVKITLDAFGEDYKFPGRIFSIDPAETKIQDVIYYKVKVNFDNLAAGQADSASGTLRFYLTNIKSGMTANVNITTASKKNVLLIPSRAIIEKTAGEKIVRILKSGTMNELPVTLGLKGDEGMIEVLSGVKAGDDVVTFVKENQ